MAEWRLRTFLDQSEQKNDHSQTSELVPGSGRSYRDESGAACPLGELLAALLHEGGGQEPGATAGRWFTIGARLEGGEGKGVRNARAGSIPRGSAKGVRLAVGLRPAAPRPSVWWGQR